MQQQRSISTTNNANTPIILVDNQGSLKLAENPEFHKRTKHIDIIYHFIRECINNNKLKVGYIPTEEQLADGFTKGLDNPKQKLLIDNLNGQLLGGVIFLLILLRGAIQVL
jgi:hypothetical protein